MNVAPTLILPVAKFDCTMMALQRYVSQVLNQLQAQNWDV